MGKSSNKYRNKEINHTNNKKMINKVYKKIILLIVFLIAITCGLTYGFFSITYKGDEKVKVVAGIFQVEFKESNTINLENATPMTDNEGMQTDEYEFSIENTGDIDARYNIGFEENNITGNTIDKKYIKYSIKEDNGEWSSPQLLSNGLMIRNERILNTGEKVNYKLKMWLIEEAGNEVEGKTFSAKVIVSSVQNNSNVGDNISPVINIANTSINVYENELFTDPIPYEIIDDNDNSIKISNVTKTYEFYDVATDTITQVNNVDTSRKGIYYIYYRVSDKNGNTGTTVVSVNVLAKSNDSIPTIMLNGLSNIEIVKGAIYEELGAIAEDKEDGILDVITIGTVNTLIEGSYTVKYITIDSNGNTVSIARNINVVNNSKIEITLGEITKENRKYNIPVNIKTTNGNLVGYYISNNNSKPNIADYTKVDKATNNYDKIFEVNSTGTYYIWAYDSNNNIESIEVIVSDNTDNIVPTCVFSDKNYMRVGSNTIDLICTDEIDIVSSNLSVDNFDINNNDIAKITNISNPIRIDNGYKYNISINGIKSGDFTLKLNKNSIENTSGIYNSEVEKDINISNLSSNIDENKLDIEVGKQKKLNIENNVGDLTYTSGNNAVATVDSNGNINGVSVGSTIVTVIDSESLSTIEITVNVYKKVTITWSGNGSNITSTTSSCEIRDNNTSCSITSPSIIKEGYNLVGFNQDKNGTTSSWDINTSKEVDSDATYYAITSKDIEVKVYYSDNGLVKNKLDNITVYNDNTYNYNVSNDITNSIGLRNLSYKGLSSKINSTDIVENTDNIIKDTVYYAVYSGEVNTNFYYYSNGQNIKTSSSEVTSVLKNESDNNYIINSSSIDVPEEVLTSSGIDNSTYYGLSKNISSKDIEDNITEENENYYAIYKGSWKINYEKDLNTVELIGSTSDSCDNYSVTNGEEYIIKGDENCTKTLPLITEKEGYTNGKWYYNDEEVGSPNEEYQINENKTLIAKAMPNKYIVKYDCTTNSGTCNIEDKTVSYGDMADISFIAEKEGYDFLGWNTDKDATNALAFAPTVTGNMTLYAIFRKSAEITLNAKVSEYTGEEIEANSAVISNGPTNPEITYTYYSDVSCENTISTPIDAGTYYVVATLEKQDGYKELKSECTPHTITPKQVNIAWSNIETFTYNGELQAPEYTAESGIANEVLELKQTMERETGEYTSKVSIVSVIGGRGNKENYQLVNDTKDYSINPADGYIVLSEDVGSIEYGQSENTFTIIDSHGGDLSVKEITTTGAEVSINDSNVVTLSNLENLAIGTIVTIRVTCSATENYYLATKDYVLTVKRPAVNPEDAVARIEEEYYTSLEDALYYARQSGDTIVMLKDTNESVENTKDVTIDLNGKKVTGINEVTITNNGILKIINTGTIENIIDTAIVNNNILTLGENDLEVSQDNPYIVGVEKGIEQDGTFNFYDGLITAKLGLVGLANDVPENYYVFVDHDNSNDYQKVYLVDDILTRAVAKTEVEGSVATYYFNLQDGINTLEAEQNLGTLYVVRDFEAAYSLEVAEETEITIDIVGHTVETGYTITNNGILNLIDSSEEKGSIEASVTITNNNILNLNEITINETTNNNVIDNNGTLNTISSHVNSSTGYGINSKTGSLNIDDNSYITSNSNYALYIPTDTEVNGGYYSSTSNYAIYIASGAEVTINDITITGKNGIHNQGITTIERGNIDVSQDVFYSCEGNPKLTVKNGNYSGNLVIDNNYLSDKSTTNLISGTYAGLVYSRYGSGTLNIGDKEDNTKIPIITNNSTVIENSLSSTVINIYNGEITGTEGAKIVGGTLNMYGGKIVGTSSSGISISTYYNSAEVNVYGGTVKGKTYGVYSSATKYQGTIVIGENDENVSTTMPEIIGGTYGLYIRSETVSFYDGILKGQTAGYYGTISDIPKKYAIENGEEQIEESIYQTSYLGKQVNFLKVGDTEYNTFEDAIGAIDSEGTIEVIATTSISEEITIPEEKNITFDLSGQTLSNIKTLINNGALKVVDSSTEQTGTYINNSTDSNTYAIKSTSNIILESGTINSNYYGVYISGEGTINGGNYSSASNYAIYIASGAEVTINDITITGKNGIHNQGITTIERGNIDVSQDVFYSCEGNPKLTVKNGNYSGNLVIDNNYLSDKSTTNLISGTYAGLVYSRYGSGTLNIGDKEDNTKIPIITNNSTVIENSLSSTVINIYNGEITGTEGAKIVGGTLNMYGGKIVGTSSSGISISTYYNSAEVNVYGGTVKGKTYGVYSSATKYQGTIVIGENDENVSTTMPEIIGGTYGLYIRSETVSFYDGILKGQTAGYYGTISDMPSSYMVADDIEIMDEVTYQISYLDKEKDIVQNGDTIYTNLQTAIDEALNGDTLTIINNATIFNDINISEDKEITIDINNHELKFNKNITNKGNLTIIDSSIDKNGKLYTIASLYLISNYGVLNISDTTLENTTTTYYLIYNYEGGSLTTNNITVNGVYGIMNYSNCEINNSIINVANSYAFYNAASSDYTVIINNSDINNTYSGSNYAIYNYNADTKVNITGGNIIGRIYNNGLLDLIGANITYDNNNDTNAIYNNNGTVSIDNSVINVETNYQYDRYGIYAYGGTTNITNSEINSVSNYGNISAIYLTNSADAAIENTTINATGNYSSSYNTYGINVDNYYTNTLLLKNNTITVSGVTKNYGIMVKSSSSSTTSASTVALESGTINVSGANVYGIYVDTGTVTMGINDGDGTENALVSIENPLVKSIGTSSGIGVKKVNGYFNFYDGKIIGSTNAKPETTTTVEYNYEASIYINEETGYEECILKYLK